VLPQKVYEGAHLRQKQAACLKRAISRPMHRKKSAAPWPEDRSSSTLFDHLVGAGEQRDRDGDAKRLGFLEVDDQLDLSELLDRQIGRLLALKNAAGVDAGLVDRWKHTNAKRSDQRKDYRSRRSSHNAERTVTRW